MAYTTVDDLAAKLKIRVTPDNEPMLQACVDAAAQEIDHYTDRLSGSPIDPDDPLAGQVNLVRAVEWWKASDAAFGVIGFADTGALQAPKNAFARHALALTPLREQWGVA
jgi:hypothetical protein